MKKISLFLTLLVVFGIYVSAQNWQKTVYNDGRVFAYIVSKQTDYWSLNKNNKLKEDVLVIENISGVEISINYSVKAITRYIGSDNFVGEKITHRTNVTLSPGYKRTERGEEAQRIDFHSHGYYRYVDAFAIMNVSVKNTSSQQNFSGNNISKTIPSWAQGTWWLGSDYWLRINSTQINFMNEVTREFTRIDGENIWFGNNVRITRSTNNKIIVGVVENGKWDTEIFEK